MVRMEAIQSVQKILAEAVAQALIHAKHSWTVYTLSRALTKALKESREAFSWPGDRLPVGARLSRHVEVLTQRLQREIDAPAGLAPFGRPAGHPAPRLPDPVKAKNDGDTPDSPVSPSFWGKRGSGRLAAVSHPYPRSRSIPGSNSGSAVTVAAMRRPKYSSSTASPSDTEAGSHA